MAALAPYDIAWIEEPTNPDDVLGHAAIARRIAPIPVASGEHMANRVMAKQFLQAGALSVLQLDATRVAGVNENIAMLLLAAKFGVRVCPHAGGVGLCEIVQHLSMFDFVAVSGTTDGRMIEFVDHLHEHFVTPVVIDRGRYRAPLAPGSGAEMLLQSIEDHRHARPDRRVDLGLGGADIGNHRVAMDDADARSLLEAAWAGGVRLFDTAPHYGLGLSERRLGEFLGGRERTGYRVSTKVGRRLVARTGPDGALDDEGFRVPAAWRRVWDFSETGIRSTLEASLTRLGLDRWTSPTCTIPSAGTSRGVCPRGSRPCTA